MDKYNSLMDLTIGDLREKMAYLDSDIELRDFLDSLLTEDEFDDWTEDSEDYDEDYDDEDEYYEDEDEDEEESYWDCLDDDARNTAELVADDIKKGNYSLEVASTVLSKEIIDVVKTLL